MKRTRYLLRTLASDQRGLSTVEYVIILVLVAVLGIGVWRSLGATIRGQVNNADAALNSLSKDEGQ